MIKSNYVKEAFQWWKASAILIAVMVLTLVGANAQYSPVPVTGFNQDIVADVSGSAPSVSTSAAVDGVAAGSFVFVTPTYQRVATTCVAAAANGWPSTITSSNTTTNTGITYTLQPATSNNSLELSATAPFSTSGTLSLVSPVSASSLYFVCLGGNGATTFSAQINFSDATTQTITGLSAPDWCGGAATNKLPTATAPQVYYRIARNAATCTGATCQYMYEIPAAISPANHGKTINSITFANTGTTFLQILAVGMQTPCSGTPAPGNTIASANPVCSGVSFSLSLQNPTGGGATYQWQTSPNGSAPWTDVSGATNPTLTTSQTTATYYQCIVTCGAFSSNSNPLQVTMSPANTCYCTPSTAGGTTYYITNMLTTGGITNLNNTSGSSATGYQNFFATASMSALQGSTVNYTMTVAGGSTYGRAIWVDWNQDGTFGAGEQAASSASYLSSPLTGSFTVPLTATTGITRMRVVATFTPNNPSNPCTNTGTGEYEDYAFNVILLAPCVTPSAQPALVSLAASSTSQINGSFSAAAGPPSGYLVVRYPGGSAETPPTDGTSYTAGQSLGLGTVIQSSNALSFSNAGLAGGTSYDYYVYSYNTACAGAPFYLTTGGFFGNVSTNACGTITSPITVGPTGTYPTLSGAGGAIAAIAATGISAPLVIEMESAYTGAGETYPITLSYDACITAAKPITIRPEATAASPITITSNNATATIDMNGAKFVTIDGRPGGVGINKYLLIENSSTTGQAVLLRNEASNNTLTYLDARASNANGSNNTSTAVEEVQYPE